MKRRSVLVWGLAEDAPTERVLNSLARRNATVIWVNQQDACFQRIVLGRADRAVRGTLYLRDGGCELSEIRSAYVRPYDWRTLEAVVGLSVDDPRYRRCAAFEAAMHMWTEIGGALVMNRLSSMASNGSKPYQAAIIHQFGFSVPDTLITTSPGAVLEFWEKHGALIYKSISGRRSVVARLQSTDRRRLSRLVRCPTQFQQWIPGRDYRVHVVGDEVFACHIDSSADDYRYDRDSAIEMSAIPESVADRCYRLTRGLGLELGGVDLRLTPSGEWFCFEVNPSPGFTYYENATGLPLSDAIASTLLGG